MITLIYAAATRGPSGPSYVNAAYISEGTGNDGTADLDDPTRPFATMDYAVQALASIHSGQPTTLVVMDDCINSVSAAGSGWQQVLAAGLTIIGINTSITYSGTLYLASGVPSDLTVDGITLSSLAKVPGDNISPADAGTITFLNGATITFLNLSGTAGEDKPPAADGGSPATGATGGGGIDGTAGGAPPVIGYSGEVVSADGGFGENGGDGFVGQSVTLLGTGSVTTLNQQGGDGGDGGDGGTGGVATGGMGGAGGSATDVSLTGISMDGAPGGAGGDAYARGGNGGNGGISGNGGNLFRNATVTIGSLLNQKGGMGFKGTGAGDGTANPGGGGPGGTGINGGADGAPGAPGNSYLGFGTDGTDGTLGTDGSETII